MEITKRISYVKRNRINNRGRSMYVINISFIKLKGKVVDNYHLTKKNWCNKDVLWEDMVKVVSNSKIQYSMTAWRNGVKTPRNLDRSKQNAICLDVDDGLSISEFQRMFKKYDYILATTKSHQKNKKGKILDRYRVIIKAINISQDDRVYFRSLELIAPFSDEQVLTPTASFLGYDNSIVIYNRGKALDLFKANELARSQLETEDADKAAMYIDPDLMPNVTNFSLESVKENLTFEAVVDVLERCGYEVVRNKFKLREDENTASATISYKSLNIKDYGGDFSGDIIQLLIDYENMTFREAIRFVSNSI